jgi:hypothetical protein
MRNGMQMSDARSSVPKIFVSQRGSADFTFAEVALTPRPGFGRVHVILGDKDDPKSSHAFWAKDPPCVVWDRQSHPTDMVVIYLEGRQKVGDTWYEAGDARIVKAGSPYGPVEAGPEGSTVLIVYATADHRPVFDDRSVESEGASPFEVHVRERDS